MARRKNYGHGTKTWADGKSAGTQVRGVRAPDTGRAPLPARRWSFIRAFAQMRPTAGVLTEASWRRFNVTYAADCQIIFYEPTPATKVCACVCPCECARCLPAEAAAHTFDLCLPLALFPLTRAISLSVSFCVYPSIFALF